MELIQYFQLLRRWWWLLIIAASLAGGVAYANTVSKESLYRARVQIFIGGYLENPNPVRGEIQTGTDLALTYSKLVTVRPILEATIAALGLDLSPGALAGRIKTGTVSETSILLLTITDPNPVQAANIANELANQLILNSPTSATPEQADRRKLIENEITVLGEQIAALRIEQKTVEDQLENTTNAEERSNLEQQRDNMSGQISSWQESIANLANSLMSLGTPINYLEIIEPALIPARPIPHSIMRNTIMAAIVAAAFAFGVAMVFEYLDDTIRGADDLRVVLNLPVLAGIVKFGKKKDSYKEKLVTVYAPNSTPVEGYRSLRANLLYGLDNESAKRLIVTSCRVAEGKSVTAANLAVTLARANLNTVIIDADLHRPQLHNIFDLENRIGLSSLLNKAISPDQQYTASQLNQITQTNGIPNLKIITSGPLPSNPAELLGLPHLHILCNSLENNLGVDIIIFDTPPVLAVADSITLATNTASLAILVIEAMKTHRASAIQVAEQLAQVGINIVGTVLNQVTNQTDGYYYYYYDYGRYKNSKDNSAG